MDAMMKENKLGMTLLLIFMCVLPILSSDIYFPILPEIARYFNTTPLAVKNSLTFFLLGFSIGQLFYGVLSDHFGRKTMLIVGLLIYLLATLACMLAPSIDFLNYARFFQGFGGCAGAIMGRAIIADSFDVKESAHIYTIIAPFIGLSPAVAPVIGAVISIYLHWQLVFAFMLCFSFILLIFIVSSLQETHTIRSKICFSDYFRNCLQLIYNKKYLCYSSFACGAYIAWFAFIVESSFLFSSYHLGLLQRSFLYVPLAVPYLIGNHFAKKLIMKNLEISYILKRGLVLYTVGLMIMLIYSLMIQNLLLIMVGMCIIVASNGFLIPLGTAGALSSIDGSHKGAATAALGFVQLVLASLGTYIVSFFQESSSQIQITLLVLFCTLIMWFCLKKINVMKFK